MTRSVIKSDNSHQELLNLLPVAFSKVLQQLSYWHILMHTCTQFHLEKDHQVLRNFLPIYCN